MTRTFFTADTHFGHARSIELCARPFADVAEMNGSMIANWNAVVQPDDTVWHLGDFVYKSACPPASIFNVLNGRKHLIVGNHDGPKTLDLPWESISQMLEIAVDGTRVFLCHYPVAEWPAYWRQAVHLYGHVHGNRRGLGRSMDVGVDVWGFRPVTLPEILQRLGDAVNE